MRIKRINRECIRSLGAAVLAAAALVSAPALAQQREALTLSEYLGALDDVAREIERLQEAAPGPATDVVARLPRVWRVQTPELAADISTDWIRRDLFAWQQRPDAGARRDLLDRLRHLRREAASALAPPADAAAARAEMTRILADPAFRGARGPSWFDRLQQRILRFLQRVLFGAIGSSVIPTVTTVLVYGLIALVAILVALRLMRSVRRGSEADLALAIGPPAQARPWSDWLTDARQAAAEGDWAQAIRRAYWCGIAYLESQGAWRPDRSRTPREYVRLLPEASPQAATLASMTRLLERAWYGADAADEARYTQALAQLKELGCPSS